MSAFGETSRELTLAALTRRCGLPRSTTHRTAAIMIRLGWLEKVADRYRIGNRLFELSGLAPVRHELREAVLPYLQDLYAAVMATVQLGVLDGTEVLVVEKITGHRPMPMLSQVGGRIPAYCSGLGRAILAFSDAEIVDSALSGDLRRRTSRTLIDQTAIRRELAAIPHRGYAVDREEGNVGVYCVAAPIFGPLGRVAAAVSVTGPASAVRVDRAGAPVRLAAAAASRAYSRR